MKLDSEDFVHCFECGSAGRGMAKITFDKSNLALCLCWRCVEALGRVVAEAKS